MMHTLGDAKPLWPVALAALAIGILLATPYIVRLLSFAVNVSTLDTVLQKLLRSDNPLRAIKVTEAAPQSPHCSAVRAALYACRDGLAFKPREQGDYRSAAVDASSAQILAMVRARYDQAFNGAMRPVVRVRLPAGLACVPLLAALASPSWIADVPAVVPAIAGLALLAIALGARADRRMFQSQQALFQSLGEAFTRLALTPEAFRDAGSEPMGEYQR